MRLACRCWVPLAAALALATTPSCRCSEDAGEEVTSASPAAASDAGPDDGLPSLRPRKAVNVDEPLEFLEGEWDGVRAVAEGGRTGSPGLFTRIARQSTHRFAGTQHTVTIRPVGDAAATPTERRWTLELDRSGDNRIRLTVRQGSIEKRAGIVVLDEDTIAIRYTGDMASTILKRRRASR